MTITFTDLITKMGDKTDKLTRHHLDKLYGPLLTPKIPTARNVLEIGLGNGGSLVALGLFFYNAKVYGVENLTYLYPPEHLPNVVFQHGDAYSTEWLDAAFSHIPKWDVILDDGSHEMKDQLFTLEYFKDKLAPNGIILIEDVKRGYVDHIFDNFTGDPKYLTLLDRTRAGHSEFDDDYVIMYYID